MCKCYLDLGRGRMMRESLVCSTNADELYRQAKAKADDWGGQVAAIEPCLMMFATAVAEPKPLD